VGVCDDGDKAGETDNGAVGEVGGGDMRGVQLEAYYKHTVDVCNDGDKTGGSAVRAPGTVDGDDIRGILLAGCC
jgi:hypothetical protein